MKSEDESIEGVNDVNDRNMFSPASLGLRNNSSSKKSSYHS